MKTSYITPETEIVKAQAGARLMDDVIPGTGEHSGPGS